MIQFNLLPDVKLDYIRTRRTKRTVMLVGVSVAGLSLAICVLLFMTVHVLQRQHLNNLTADIKRDTAQLKAVEDIDKILTVQNQLNKLTELHAAKPVASRLKTYLPQITPKDITYSEIIVDFETNNVTFTGNAPSLKAINQFVDTIKFTKYTAGDNPEQLVAFTEVSLVNFSLSEDTGSYEISLKFDPQIFSSTTGVKLVVPNTVTTRSAVEQPSEPLLTPDPNQGAGE